MWQLDQEQILVFDSNFECGNLERACIVSLAEYNLFLHVDTNTGGHTQWFYFAVTNTQQGRSVTFHILNCTNSVVLFKAGMRPVVFSELDHEATSLSWLPDTDNVRYEKSDLAVLARSHDGKASEARPYYKLSFTHTFKHTGDRVYFAYSRPYSVTMLSQRLNSLRDTLQQGARHVSTLPEPKLQQRIQEFVAEEKHKQSETIAGSRPASRPRLQPEDQFRKRRERRKDSALEFGKNRSLSLLEPEHSLVGHDVLERFAAAPDRCDWLRTEDWQIDTDDFFYRQETLSRTLSGLPVELITITAHTYLDFNGVLATICIPFTSDLSSSSPLASTPQKLLGRS